MSGGAYASVNVWQCMLDVRQFKKMRVAGPPSTALITGASADQMKGFGQLHAVLMRISYAQDEHDVFGLDLDALFTVEDLESRFEEAFAVLRRDNVLKVHPLLFPISRKALQRVRWASKTICQKLEMLTRSLTCSVVRADYNVRDKIDWD